MSVTMLSSLLMLDRCALYSKTRMTEVSLHEPDDQVYQYIDFLERINPADWGNDFYLLELIDNVFCRKKGAGERVFLNPPYGREIIAWVEKAYTETQPNFFETDTAEIVVALLPVRTDTKWFHKYVYHKAEIRFVRGRLYFNNNEGAAPFPNMIVIWRGNE